jgi:hypothetical protein
VTQQKDLLVDRLVSLWELPAEALYGCPISLPA